MYHQNRFFNGLAMCALLITSLTLSLPDFLSAQTFQIADSLVSDPDVLLMDPEFDPYNSRMCWQSFENELWTCDIDPVTGKLTRLDGREQLIDTNIVPMPFTWNGPEWMFSQGGSRIVYHQKFGSQKFVSQAFEYAENQWALTPYLDKQPRQTPRASKNPADPFPIVHYVGDGGGIWWRGPQHNYEERQIPGVRDGHIAEDSLVMSLIIDFPHPQPDQIGIFNFDTETIAQVTWGGDHKSRPYMWIAPENDELVMFAREDTALVIYQQNDTGWVVTRRITSPSGDPAKRFIASPEPFTFDGVSYVCFMASSTPLEIDGVVAEIWIARLLDGDPVFRMVSDSAPRARTDPEPYVLDDKVWVYYTEVIDDD
ncbi:MAG: hypothetical protein AAF570_14210, partial [Bacteroidota bacterium]